MKISLRHQHQHLQIDAVARGDHYEVTVDGKTYTVYQARSGSPSVFTIDGRAVQAYAAARDDEYLVALNGSTYSFHRERRSDSGHAVEAMISPEIVAPMPGKVTQVLVEPGTKVAVGDPLIILEAMKMENRLVAEAAGTVTSVAVAAGSMVDGGQVLLVIEYDQPES